MRKLAMVLFLVLVMVLSAVVAIAQDERRPEEQFIYGIGTVTDIELVRSKGCLVELDLEYSGLLFFVEARAPQLICDSLWVSAIVDQSVDMKLAYRVDPLRLRIVRIALNDLTRDNDD